MVMGSSLTLGSAVGIDDSHLRCGWFASNKTSGGKLSPLLVTSTNTLRGIGVEAFPGTITTASLGTTAAISQLTLPVDGGLGGLGGIAFLIATD